MIYSTVTNEEMEEILQEYNKTNSLTIPEHITVKSLSTYTPCIYAEDLGEKAFINAPCRGNKIKCKKIEGHISYTKACTPDSCKYFEGEGKYN